MSSAVTLIACAASLSLALAACGSDSKTSSDGTAPLSKVSSAMPDAPMLDALSSAPEAPVTASPCPMAPPAAGGTPQWTLPGATGSVAVTGSTDTAAPVVTVDGPFSVSQTQVKTLTAGDGPVVAPTATVSVCYMGVNGRDGTVFDSSYERGAPAEFALDQVVPGFQKAIAGQNVGSTVAVAMVSADGYPDGQPAAGIKAGDSLIFAIKILDASN
jgi:hypothetical protein